MAINTHLMLVLLLFLAFAGISVAFARENKIGGAVVSGILTLLPIFAFAVSPLYVVFDGEAVKIVYNFGRSETISWNSIRKISLMGSWLGGGGPPNYVISFPRKEKSVFFVMDQIPKTRRTKRLIKLYYKGEIL